MTERPTDGFIISREEFAELTRLYAARINSKNVGRIPAIFNSVRSHPYQSERERLHFSSSDLLLMAHDEWKRREERKHIHEHISWVNGWISGFLTSRKFVQEKVAELRQKGGVCMRGLEKCSKDCDDCPDTYTCSESSK